ncbi:hypothetical protein [Roseovarius salis]|uniref:hypothetical protein n=1 Tax=Roseovarius salis TaxID=3376063 RepID=UPI0037CB6943
MEHVHEATAEARTTAYAARARAARVWARRVLLLLTAVYLFGVWQNRPLAPDIHDGMRTLAGRAVYVAENTDKVRAYIRQALTSPTGTSAEPRYNAITRWLLKWKDW